MFISGRIILLVLTLISVHTDDHAIGQSNIPDWKQVINFKDNPRGEIYYLSKGPEEKIHLIGQNSSDTKAIINQLTKNIYQKMEKVGDPLMDSIVLPETQIT